MPVHVHLDLRIAGTDTVRATRTGLKGPLGDRLHLVLFPALLGFSTLTTIGANTGSRFGTLIAVNTVGISVQLNSPIGLIPFPVGFVRALLFLRIVDAPASAHSTPSP